MSEPVTEELLASYQHWVEETLRTHDQGMTISPEAWAGATDRLIDEVRKLRETALAQAKVIHLIEEEPETDLPDERCPFTWAKGAQQVRCGLPIHGPGIHEEGEV